MVYSFLITLTVLVGQVAPKEAEPDKDNQCADQRLLFELGRRPGTRA